MTRAGKLIPRTVDDQNFAHCVRMFPLLRMWAAAIKEGDTIDFNDRNMVHLPVEIAEAFIRAHAGDDSELGAACAATIASIDGGILSDGGIFAPSTGRATKLPGDSACG